MKIIEKPTSKPQNTQTAAQHSKFIKYVKNIKRESVQPAVSTPYTSYFIQFVNYEAFSMDF